MQKNNDCITRQNVLDNHIQENTARYNKLG
nr:MAG TPA: hypothetical protein [Caudoviricetes sp.]